MRRVGLSGDNVELFALVIAVAGGGLFFVVALIFFLVRRSGRSAPAPMPVTRPAPTLPPTSPPTHDGISLPATESQMTFSEGVAAGPLLGLLEDATVSEIMVNRFDRVFVERNGRLELTDVAFRDDAHVVETIRRLIAEARRRIDDASPMVDARLEDGSRVNAVLHPLATRGPSLTIRKFSAAVFGMEHLLELGALSQEMSTFLHRCVLERRNILVSGGSGSGKTTLLNVLGAVIPHDERIITIEDAAELKLAQANVVGLEARPANLEGTGEITIRHLVVNALRMRPDRIIVGEVRSVEALDMLQAMNTGHDGSLTTLHANSPKDALLRLETLTLMAGMELPINAVRQQVAAAIDIVVQTARLADGSRKVVHIAELAGMRSGAILLRDIFKFRDDGLDPDGRVQGEFLPVNQTPASVKHTPSAAQQRTAFPHADVLSRHVRWS